MSWLEEEHDAELQKGLDAYCVGDYATARAVLTPLADKKDEKYDDARLVLSVMYAMCRIVPKNFAPLLEWTRRMAKNCDDSKYVLGVMYEKGLGVAPDNAKAVKWIFRAAMGGYIHAQANLGLKYYTGEDVEKDYCLAYACFNLVAEQVDSEWKYFTGTECVDQGEKMVKDYLDRIEKEKLLTPEQLDKIQKMSWLYLLQSDKGFNG